MARLLIVDDEPSTLSVLNTLLKAEGYDVTAALGGEQAKELIRNEDFDLMLCDIRMSPINGMELLRMVHDERPAMSVIMLTAYGSVKTAIEALKLGAFDYVTKPFKVDALIYPIQRALEYNRAITENADLKAQLGTRYRLENIVAESESMKKVCEMIKRVAPTDATVLISGESGTGKEVVAKAIHSCSPRQNKSFLPVNCAALPEPLLESEMFGHVKGAFTGASANKEGLFEAASGGTIFLDEIGAMPLSIQSKLLRVLQEREVRRVGSNDTVPIDCRVLGATNTPLKQLLDEGKFREDLFYRLSVITIDLEPIRSRKEDILPLAYHFLRKEVPEGKHPPIMEPEVCAILESYAWPGNVRQLENAIKHAVTFCTGEKISKDVLPPKIAQTPIDADAGGLPTDGDADASRCKSLKAFLRAKEQDYLKQVLEMCGGNKEEAAKRLNISLATLYRKLPEEK